MKLLIKLSIIFFLSQTVIAQSGKTLINNNAVLYITTAKTTSLIFENSIEYIDRGTTDILVQQVSSEENVILLKAAANDFKETNLSVITDDGKIYSFNIRYDTRQPSNIYYVKEDTSETPGISKREKLSASAITSYCNAIATNDRKIHGIKDRKWGIKASVSSIYIKNNLLFFRLVLNNRSPIDYDIDVMRFYIMDKVKPKRTAVQELEQTPVRITGNVRKVKAGSENVIVTALQKFTIPDAKYLVIQFMEKNGGRNITLKVKNAKIVKAKQLADLK